MRLRRALAALAAASGVAAAAAIAGHAVAADGERTAQANYILRCAGCHGMAGAGVPHAGIPDFHGLVGVFAGDEEGRTYLFNVPGVVGSSLSDAEKAAVMNLIMKRWAGESLPADFAAFTAEEVTARRAVPVESIVDFRRAIVDRLSAEGIVTAEYPWP
ncbi:MAG: hypothetical protein KIS96_02840 [Bauldia sp.]|nr:hypothetical protein [Bauldia sp.]